MSEQYPGNLVNGLDIYTFPGVVPEDVHVLDKYPVQAIPDAFAHLQADLDGELAQAQPDGLGRRSACVLVGCEQTYGGHSVTNATGVIGSFAMALDGLPEDVGLRGAMTVAVGPNAKEKSSLPSIADFDKLWPHLFENATFTVVQAEDPTLWRVVPAADVASAYKYGLEAGPATLTEFAGQTVEASTIEAIRNTALSVRDCEFIARLRFAGLDTGVAYYLTGSGSGLGGPSIALRPTGPYRDLDIIAIGDRSGAELEAGFEAFAQEFYGPLQKQRKQVPVGGSDKLLTGCVYSSTPADIAIDFYAGNQLDAVLVRPEYLERGLLLKLS